jgi:hypothetical protein
LVESAGRYFFSLQAEELVGLPSTATNDKTTACEEKPSAVRFSLDVMEKRRGQLMEQGSAAPHRTEKKPCKTAAATRIKRLK